MAAVSDLLKKKGTDVLTVSPGSPAREAIEKMENLGVGTAVVTEGDEVVGIVSERDVLRKVVLQDKDLASVEVREIMSTGLTTVAGDTTVAKCMELITEKRIRHLPVVCGKKLCGIVSIGDLVKFLLREKDNMIKNLETYITGSII